MAYLPKSTKSYSNRSVNFISARSFFSHTNSESWQYSRYINLLHFFVIYNTAENISYKLDRQITLPHAVLYVVCTMYNSIIYIFLSDHIILNIRVVICLIFTQNKC